MPNEEGGFPIHIRDKVGLVQALCYLRLVEAFFHVFLIVCIYQLLHLLHQLWVNSMVLDLHIQAMVWTKDLDCIQMERKGKWKNNVVFINITTKKPRFSQASCNRAMVFARSSPSSLLKSILGTSMTSNILL